MLFTVEEINDFEKMISEKNAAFEFGLELSDILELILKACNDDLRNRYFALLQEEKDSHSPQVQHDLSLILLEMGNVLHQQQYPNTPVCQWLRETYRSPALFWSIKAVSQNYAPAYRTESMLVSTASKDICEDLELSRALLLKGAMAGDPVAQCSLAFDYASDNMFGFKRLVEYDMDKADYWYQKAADSNDPRCFWSLADHYNYRAKDYKKAAYYYKKIIKIGNTENNKDPYTELTYCYAKLNDVEACKKCIYITLQNRDGLACFAIYEILDRLNADFWPVIDDVNLELALLQRACLCDDQRVSYRAKYIVKTSYKMSRLGKIKRLK